MVITIAGASHLRWSSFPDFVVSLCSGLQYLDNGTKAREQQNQPFADFVCKQKKTKQNQVKAYFYFWPA